MKEKITTIPLSKSVKKKLYLLKIKLNFRTWDDLLKHMINQGDFSVK